MTRSEPEAVWQVARSGGNVRQPDRVLADQIAGLKAEPWPGAREEWRAMAKHHGVEVESILIDQTKLAQASSQLWSADMNLARALRLQPADHRLDVVPDKRGVGADRRQ